LKAARQFILSCRVIAGTVPYQVTQASLLVSHIPFDTELYCYMHEQLVQCHTWVTLILQVTPRKQIRQ